MAFVWGDGIIWLVWFSWWLSFIEVRVFWGNPVFLSNWRIAVILPFIGLVIPWTRPKPHFLLSASPSSYWLFSSLSACSEAKMQRRCSRTLSSQPPRPQRKSETGSRGFKVITFTSPVFFIFQSKVAGSFHTWQEISKLFCFHLLFLILELIWSSITWLIEFLPDRTSHVLDSQCPTV